MKLALCLLLVIGLTSCVRPKRYYVNTRQTLLFGTDAATYAGCVRGVIRWHHDRTGQWPAYAQVEELCAGVQKSFTEEMNSDALDPL